MTFQVACTAKAGNCKRRNSRLDSDAKVLAGWAEELELVSDLRKSVGFSGRRIHCLRRRDAEKTMTTPYKRFAPRFIPFITASRRIAFECSRHAPFRFLVSRPRRRRSPWPCQPCLSEYVTPPLATHTQRCKAINCGFHILRAWDIFKGLWWHVARRTIRGRVIAQI